MKYKISVELDEVQYQGFRAILALIGSMAIVQVEGSASEQEIRRVMTKQEVVVKPDQSTVKYVAKVDLQEALKDLGDKTVVGLIYAYLVEAGPMTQKEIKLSRPWKPKTIESCLYMLRHKGFVESVSMIEQEVTHEVAVAQEVASV